MPITACSTKTTSPLVTGGPPAPPCASSPPLIAHLAPRVCKKKKQTETVSTHDLVVGDVVMLSTGDILPTDGIILGQLPTPYIPYTLCPLPTPYNPYRKTYTRTRQSSRPMAASSVSSLLISISR